MKHGDDSWCYRACCIALVLWACQHQVAFVLHLRPCDVCSKVDVLSLALSCSSASPRGLRSLRNQDITRQLCFEIGVDLAVGAIQLVNGRKLMEHYDALTRRI
jgi:hypothetical protein